MGDFGLGNFVEKDSLIRTRHEGRLDWVTNIVYEVRDELDELDIALERSYIEGIIMVGDSVLCKYSDENCEYSITGHVAGINLSCPQKLTIKVDYVEKHDDMRDCCRYDVYLCTVVKSRADANTSAFAILINISEIGAAFVSGEELEKSLKFEGNEAIGSKVYMEVYVSMEETFSIEGTVIRKAPRKKGIEYGVRFDQLDEKNGRNLKELNLKLANKDKEFYNKQRR